mmetsp:Transcript_63880/g.202135  ORF Transcript_63880/g.202135 Transcript_63880/m.202135 type:complete len:368 (-) Transcript_63880:910-2013(-)
MLGGEERPRPQAPRHDPLHVLRQPLGVPQGHVPVHVALQEDPPREPLDERPQVARGDGGGHRHVLLHMPPLGLLQHGCGVHGPLVRLVVLDIGVVLQDPLADDFEPLVVHLVGGDPGDDGIDEHEQLVAVAGAVELETVGGVADHVGEPRDLRIVRNLIEGVDEALGEEAREHGRLGAVVRGGRDEVQVHHPLGHLKKRLRLVPQPGHLRLPDEGGRVHRGPGWRLRGQEREVRGHELVGGGEVQAGIRAGVQARGHPRVREALRRVGSPVPRLGRVGAPLELLAAPERAHVGRGHALEHLTDPRLVVLLRHRVRAQEPVPLLVYLHPRGEGGAHGVRAELVAEVEPRLVYRHNLVENPPLDALGAE